MFFRRRLCRCFWIREQAGAVHRAWEQSLKLSINLGVFVLAGNWSFAWLICVCVHMNNSQIYAFGYPHTHPGVCWTENVLASRYPEAEQLFLQFIFPKHCCRPDIFSYSCMCYKIIFFKMGKISSYFHSVLLQKSLEKLTFLCIRLQTSEFRRGERVRGSRMWAWNKGSLVLWRGKQGWFCFVGDPLWVLTKEWIPWMSSLCAVSIHAVISTCNSARVMGVVNSAVALHVVSICQSPGLFLQQIS